MGGSGARRRRREARVTSASLSPSLFVFLSSSHLQIDGKIAPLHSSERRRRRRRTDRKETSDKWRRRRVPTWRLSLASTRTRRRRWKANQNQWRPKRRSSIHLSPSLSLSLSLSSAKPCSRPRPQTRHFALKCKVSLIGLEGNSTVSKNRRRRMTIQFLPSFPGA